MTEHRDETPRPRYDRALLLHGAKRNEVLTLAEVEQYGLDAFGRAEYLSIYGMPPREWYHRGIRLLGRTAVECTRDALADPIGRDIAAVARLSPTGSFLAVDPFAGSCNTLYWILRHVPASEGLAFELDPQVFDLTRRNVATLDRRIELIHGDYASLIQRRPIPADRALILFVAPPGARLWTRPGDWTFEARRRRSRRSSSPSGAGTRRTRCWSRRRCTRRSTRIPSPRFERSSNGPSCASTSSTPRAGTTASCSERGAGRPRPPRSPATDQGDRGAAPTGQAEATHPRYGRSSLQMYWAMLFGCTSL